MRSRARIGSWLWRRHPSPRRSVSPPRSLPRPLRRRRRPRFCARPPLVLGVAIDEAGMAQADLQRSQDLVLALLDKLPEGSQMMIGSFSGEKRIVLPPTADRALVTATLAGFEAGASGVALPDGLFDMVEYLGAQDFAARALLLVSAGRVREGDLQFEDPLNAATSKECSHLRPGSWPGRRQTPASHRQDHGRRVRPPGSGGCRDARPVDRTARGIGLIQRGIVAEPGTALASSHAENRDRPARRRRDLLLARRPAHAGDRGAPDPPDERARDAARGRAGSAPALARPLAVAPAETRLSA